jgi:hypothetical protein
MMALAVLPATCMTGPALRITAMRLAVFSNCNPQDDRRAHNPGKAATPLGAGLAS